MFVGAGNTAIMNQATNKKPGRPCRIAGYYIEPVQLTDLLIFNQPAANAFDIAA